MYFSLFKLQDWRKRSVVRGRGFIQRFLKPCYRELLSSSCWIWFRWLCTVPSS